MSSLKLSIEAGAGARESLGIEAEDLEAFLREFEVGSDAQKVLVAEGLKGIGSVLAGGPGGEVPGVLELAESTRDMVAGLMTSSNKSDKSLGMVWAALIYNGKHVEKIKAATNPET